MPKGKRFGPRRQSEVSAHSHEDLPVGYFVLSAYGEILDVNRTGAGLLHLRRHVLQNERLRSFLKGPADVRMFQTHLKTVFHDRAPHTCDVWLRGKQGNFCVRLHSRTANPVKGAERVAQTIVIDITELKITEEKLSRSEKLFRLSFEGAKDAMFWVDLSRETIVKCNKAAEKMCGVPRSELIGLHMSKLHPPELVQQFAALFNRDMKKKKGRLDGESVVLSRSGRRIPVHVTTSVTRTADQNILQGIFRNVTERKESEKTLRQAIVRATEEKAKSDAVIAAIGDHLVILDRGFRIIYQNEISKKMMGVHVGKRCYEAVGGTGRICENCPVELSFRDGRIHRGERIAAFGKNGRNMEMTASPLRDASGNVTAVIEVVRDVTERKRGEDVLRRSRDELEMLVDARTAEMSNMNKQLRDLSVYLQNSRENERTMIAREIHDELGQSLTALKIDLSLLKKNLPGNPKQCLERTESMGALIESTIQSVKRISTELRPGILDHLGLSAAIEWQTRDFERRTGIVCTLVFEPDEIALDRERTTTVFRIFQETLTNVARHAKASKLSVVLTLQPGVLLIKVTDNGKGITEKQASDPKSLGLIGIRERVYSWGGTLAIKGAKNKGTVVTVRIPLDSGGDRG